MTERQEEGHKTTQQCWKLMSRSEKMLVLLIVIIVFILLGLFIFIIILLLTAKPLYCHSATCVIAAANLLETIDSNANPCTNFQQFVCGNYIERFHNVNLTELKKAALISAPIEESDSESLVMVKRFYQACNDIDRMDKNGNRILSKFIHDIGGWSLLLGERWDADNINWLKFMVRLRRLGMKNDWFVNFDYFQDVNGTNLLLIRPPNVTSIPKDLQLTFYDSFVRVAETFGASKEFALDEAKKFNSFQDELVTITEKAHKSMKTNNYFNVTFQMLNGIWREVDLIQIFNNLASNAIFNENTTIMVASETYINDLDNLLSRTSKRTIANYLVWKVIEIYIPFASQNIRESYEKFLQIESREDFCFAETQKRFHGVIEKLYLDRNKDERITDELKKMANLIREELTDDFEINVVIMGVDDENAGISEIQFKTKDVMPMINQIHLEMEKRFYYCIGRNSTECSKEGYYEDNQEKEPYFDSFYNTIYLPHKLFYNDSYNGDWPYYLNYARLGRIMSDTLIKKLKPNNGINGVDLSYESYTKLVPADDSEMLLPGLNYTSRQLFWITTTYPYCSFQNDTAKFNEVKNSKHFQTVFQCNKHVIKLV